MEARNPTNDQSVVLVVDDDPAVCNSLKFSLELEGFTVRTFSDEATVLNSADAGDAQCLIVDYKLPRMNGLELLQELRARGFLTPAILITSHPNVELSQAAERQGIFIVEKPFLDNALSETVHIACKTVYRQR